MFDKGALLSAEIVQWGDTNKYMSIVGFLKGHHKIVIVNTAYNGNIWRAIRRLDSKTSSVECYLNKNRSKESARLK